MGSFAPLHWLIIGVICIGAFGVVMVAVLLAMWAGRSAAPKSGPNLDPCPDCGQMVSRLAKTCPRCGRPLHQP